MVTRKRPEFYTEEHEVFLSAYKCLYMFLRIKNISVRFRVPSVELRVALLSKLLFGFTGQL